MPALLQAFASALMLAPLLALDLNAFIGNSDALFYTTILGMVSDHLWAGDIFPVWLKEANSGLGSPVMLYHNALAYQITALLGLPIASIDPLGWKRLLLGMFAAQWLAGMLVYIWLKRLVNPAYALAASLLFTVFPYKFIYIFLHINLAQLWALCPLPLLMMAAEDMARGRRKPIVWYGLALALLALIHPRTAVAFGALPACYALIQARVPRSRVLLYLILAHLLAAALSAFYWLPAGLNTGLVHTGLGYTGRFYYAENLSHKDLLFNFHYALIAALAFGLMLRSSALHYYAGKEITFYIAAIIAAAFLCLRISKPVWDMIPLLQFLQFPAARLHVVALIAATALVALFLQYRTQLHPRRALYSLPILLVPILTVTVMTLRYIDDTYASANIRVADIQQAHDNHMILPQDYNTRWQPKGGTPIPKSQALAAIVAGSGEADAVWEGKRSLRLLAQIDSPKATVQLHQFYLPQWHADNLAIQSNPQGLMVITLPQGKHDIVVQLGDFAYEEESKLISLGALLIALYFLWKRQHRHRMH